MKNSDLFEIINYVLMNSKIAPMDILDYGLPETLSLYQEDIVGIKFSPIFKTRYGVSEGIYTNCYIEGDFLGQHKMIRLGTYKTLYDQKDDYRRMCQIGAEFCLALIKFVDIHEALFTQNTDLKAEDIAQLENDFIKSYDAFNIYK